MPQDAIIGARYEDSVFDSEFTVVAVRADESESVASDENITVVLDYDAFEDTTEVSLAQFRQDESIEVVEVPDHAG